MPDERIRERVPRRPTRWQRRLQDPLPLLLLGLWIATLAVSGLLLAPLAHPATPARHEPAKSQAGATSVPWDSRACLQSPSAQTCDGKLVVAPADLAAISYVAGSGVCMNEYAQHVTQDLYTTSTHQLLGGVELWSFPSCQAHAAHVFWHRDGVADMRIELRLGFAARAGDPWTPDERYQTSYQVQVQEQREAWSPLVWSPQSPLSACGSIGASPQEIGQTCTPWFQANLARLAS